MSDTEAFVVSLYGYSSNELEWWPYFICVSEWARLPAEVFGGECEGRSG